MLLQTVTLVEAFEAIFTLEFRLMWYIVRIKCRRMRVRLGFPSLWLFYVDQLVLSLFMFLQVLFIAKCFIAKCTVDNLVRRNTFLLYLDV